MRRPVLRAERAEAMTQFEMPAAKRRVCSRRLTTLSFFLARGISTDSGLADSAAGRAGSTTSQRLQRSAEEILTPPSMSARRNFSDYYRTKLLNLAAPRTAYTTPWRSWTCAGLIKCVVTQNAGRPALARGQPPGSLDIHGKHL